MGVGGLCRMTVWYVVVAVVCQGKWVGVSVLCRMTVWCVVVAVVCQV